MSKKEEAENVSLSAPQLCLSFCGEGVSSSALSFTPIAHDFNPIQACFGRSHILALSGILSKKILSLFRQTTQTYPFPSFFLDAGEVWSMGKGRSGELGLGPNLKATNILTRISFQSVATSVPSPSTTSPAVPASWVSYKPQSREKRLRGEAFLLESKSDSSDQPYFLN